MSTFADPYPRRRSGVDIRGRSVQPDILVALLDRPNEMKALASRNPHFYSALENYIIETQGADAWAEFQDICYALRQELNDREWMAAISRYLANNPAFLAKFKESVGYDDPSTRGDGGNEPSDYYDDEDEDEEEVEELAEEPSQFANLVAAATAAAGDEAPPQRRKSSQLLHPIFHQAIPQNGSSYSRRLDLIQMRRYPDIQERLPLVCPAFFRKAKQLMSRASCSDKLYSAARRNSILDQQEPDSTVAADLDDQPRFNWCEHGQLDAYDKFVKTVCTTRREQPDDGEWVNAVLEALDGWPELLDDLRDIARSLDEDDDLEEKEEAPAIVQ